MNVQNIKQFALRLDPMRTFPLALLALVAITACVDLLLAFQPTVIWPLRDGFQRWVGTGTGLSSWPGLFAASISVVSIAVAAAILVSFIHGVKRAPYVWLASMFVSTCMLVMNGLSVKLPWPGPTPFFTALSVLLLISGGAVFLLGSVLRICTGIMLIFVPFVLLLVGYLQSKPIANLSSGELLFTAILALATLGTLALSIVSQRMLEDADNRASSERQAEYLRTQIIELLERCKATEARAFRAEQQLAQHLAFPVRETLRR
jgi:hypothetical protein